MSLLETLFITVIVLPLTLYVIVFVAQLLGLWRVK